MTSPQRLPRLPRLIQAFDPRRNSLNFLRLAFALFVVLGHCSPVGFGHRAPRLGSLAYEDIPVDGFFVISGFLVTRSRIASKSTWDYMVKRVLRIYPGFWVCLLAGALVVAPTIWFHEHHTLSGYLASSAENPFSYLITNVTIYVHQYGVDNLLHNAPVPDSINGSLWTLVYELLCYIMVAVLFKLGLLARRRIVLALTALVYGSYLLVEYDFSFVASLAHTTTVHLKDPPELVLMFLIGTCLYLFADVLAFSDIIGVASIVLFGLCGFLDHWIVLGAVPFAYSVFWLAFRLPAFFQEVGQNRDFSYGVYLYGWPSQVLLYTWGVQHHGFLPYATAAIVMSLTLAYLSWTFVESRALRLKGPLTSLPLLVKQQKEKRTEPVTRVAEITYFFGFSHAASLDGSTKMNCGIAHAKDSSLLE